MKPSEPKGRWCRNNGLHMHTAARGVRAEDRRRLDLVIYGAQPDGSALCCDAIGIATYAPGAATAMQPTRSSMAKGRRNSSCLATRSQRRCTAFGTRPGPTTSDTKHCAGPRGRCGFRLDASLVGHAVCRSAAGGCRHCPRPAMAPTAACHQRRGPTARPRAQPRRGGGSEPPAAATLVGLVECRHVGLGLPQDPVSGHEVGRSKKNPQQTQRLQTPLGPWGSIWAGV